jgi:hypothetical protein
VKVDVAARAKEHAAQARTVAKGEPCGSRGAAAGYISAAGVAAAAVADNTCAGAAQKAAVELKAGDFAPTAAAGTVTGQLKQRKGLKGRRGASSNRAEELPSVNEATVPRAACVAATGIACNAASPPWQPISMVAEEWLSQQHQHPLHPPH